MSLSCDLFCRVVDNFGDAAVCWRLARQLVEEFGWRVRLWIDDSTPLAMLEPGVARGQDRQTVAGVDICHWPPSFPEVQPAQVVIEAFACVLPEGFVRAMAAQAKPPVWLNLEYLSAEPWVAGCHGLASPHPSLPLVKYFFFPGFVAGTGGLLRERGLTLRPPSRPLASPLRVSLFCYRNPSLPALLDAWRNGGQPVHCRVAAGMAREQVEDWLGKPLTEATTECGWLQLSALPFLPQPEYDRLLCDCDLNFVRGEDSFVRAQWAGRPFVWQAYPQSEDAHLDKLGAFLDIYGADLAPAAARALKDFSRAWNGAGPLAPAWRPLVEQLEALAAHGLPWAEQMARHGSLAENLASFCVDRI
jgi:uncharacterized repeat protein (TIGR03837 family)